jgi:ABC-type proline/glycine betaine transport system permease subunit
VTTRRFLVIAVPSLLAAAVCLALAPALDQRWLYIAGMGFVVAAVAGQGAWFDDRILASLVVVAFIAVVVVGLVNGA